jgi:hypothetical protein
MLGSRSFWVKSPAAKLESSLSSSFGNDAGQKASMGIRGRKAVGRHDAKGCKPDRGLGGGRRSGLEALLLLTGGWSQGPLVRRSKSVHSGGGSRVTESVRGSVSLLLTRSTTPRSSCLRSWLEDGIPSGANREGL